MRSKSIIILILILAIVGGSTFVAINGVKVGKYEIGTAKDSME